MAEALFLRVCRFPSVPATGAHTSAASPPVHTHEFFSCSVAICAFYRALDVIVALNRFPYSVKLIDCNVLSFILFGGHLLFVC